MSGKTARRNRETAKSKQANCVAGFPVVGRDAVLITTNLAGDLPVLIHWGVNHAVIDTDGNISIQATPEPYLLPLIYGYSSAGIHNPMDTVFVHTGNAVVAFNESGVFHLANGGSSFQHIADVADAPSSVVVSSGMYSIRLQDHMARQTYYEHPAGEVNSIVDWLLGSKASQRKPSFERISLMPFEKLRVLYDHTFASYKTDDFRFWGKVSPDTLSDDMSALVKKIGANTTIVFP